MNISNIISKFKMQIFKMLYEDKEYKFSCTAETSMTMDKDFIFIPLVQTDKFEETLKNVFKNPNCKGVIFNEKLLKVDAYKVWFNSFMKENSSKIEFLAFVPNIYNLTLSIILEKFIYYSGEVVTVVGTNGTYEVAELLKYFLEGKYNVVGTELGWTCWQKLFEPILISDENTEIVLLEAVPEKVGLLPIVQNFSNNHIIFTKSSIYNMNLYEDMEALSNELLKVLVKPKFVKSIILNQDNDLISDYISYEYQDKIHWATEILSDDNSKCLAPYISLANTFLHYKNLPSCDFSNFESGLNLYSSSKNGNNEIFVVNNEDLSVSSVLKSLDEFEALYSDKNKIIVFEYIKNLGNFKSNVYDEIFTKIAKLNPSNLILININNYNHLYRRINKTTYIQNIKYTLDNKSSIEQMKYYLKNLRDKNNSVIYARLNENTINLLSEDDCEIFG